MNRLTKLITLIATAVLVPGAVMAQSGGPYAPKVIVNDRVVSNYEYSQRLAFMMLLSRGATTEEQTLDALIDDRLRLQAAKDMGLSAAPETVEAGMAEFAARANLSVDEFVAAIGEAGVAAHTFRDFVEAGILWREVVRSRFGPRAQITEAEIDRAMATASREGGARVLLSEIILPADTPEARTRALRLAERLQREVKSPQAFATAAQQHSASGTRGRGGRMDWTPIASLPPAVRTAVIGLAPGQVSAPVEVPGAIGLFLLRELDEQSFAETGTAALEYARLYLKQGTQAEVDRISARVDTCDDLYGEAKGLPEDQLLREVATLDQLPEDVALGLALLDDNEMTLLGGNTPSLLMLCARTPDIDNEADRTAIRQQLVNQRLVSYANAYLAELKADAIIRYP